MLGSNLQSLLGVTVLFILIVRRLPGQLLRHHVQDETILCSDPTDRSVSIWQYYQRDTSSGQIPNHSMIRQQTNDKNSTHSEETCVNNGSRIGIAFRKNPESMKLTISLLVSKVLFRREYNRNDLRLLLPAVNNLFMLGAGDGR